MTVLCLDDSDREEVRQMAAEFGFTYLCRPNRGWFKKVGNLQYGYANSHGEYLMVFDADFCPRPDIVREMMPYFDQNPRLGIVQSPQYFRVTRRQSWIERGAGAVQSSFTASYRHRVSNVRARSALAPTPSSAESPWTPTAAPP
jgi:cellulose synthase (UDP-forming)